MVYELHGGPSFSAFSLSFTRPLPSAHAKHAATDDALSEMLMQYMAIARVRDHDLVIHTDTVLKQSS